MDDTLAKRRFWSTVILEHYDVLLRYARRLTNGDESRALDLVQLVASRILQYLPEPTSVKSAKAYLIRSVFNSWAKSKRRVEEVSLDQCYEEMIERSCIALDPQIQTNFELIQVLDRALEEMVQSFPEFELLWKMWLEGHSFPEISQELGRDLRFTKFLWERFKSKARRHMTS